MTFLSIFLFGFLFTLFGVKLALALFPRFHLMDQPERFGLTRAPIPYSGGIILFFVFVLGTLFFIPFGKAVFGVLLGATLIAIVSFWDDRVSLPPIFRLFVQILASLLIVFSGIGIQSINNPFGAPILLDTIRFQIFGQEIWLLSALFVIVWLILTMNVTNWLDGIPGQVSGMGVITTLLIFLFSIQRFHQVDQTTVSLLSLLLASSLLAFLLFDFPPPKILMGDTGSMFVGFLLGILAIFSGGKIATLLLILGVPVVDAIIVTLRRMITGQSPLKGDFTHLHHRLLRIGFSEQKALSFNFGFSVLFGGAAFFLPTTFLKVLALAILVLASVTLSFIIFSLEKKR